MAALTAGQEAGPGGRRRTRGVGVDAAGTAAGLFVVDGGAATAAVWEEPESVEGAPRGG